MTGPEQPNLPRLLVGLLAAVLFTAFFSRALSQMLLGVTLAVALWQGTLIRQILAVGSLKRWLFVAALFVVWIGISSWAGFDPAHSFYAMRREWLLVLVPLVAVVAAKDDYRQSLFTAMAAGLLLFSLYGISQYATGWDWLNWEGHWFKPAPLSFISGNYSRPLTYAVVFSSAAVLMLCLGCDTGITTPRRRLYLVAALSAFAAVLLAQRRGPLLALLAVLLALVFFGPGRIRPVALLLLVLGGVVTLILPGGVHRFTEELSAEWLGAYQNTRLYIWTKTTALIGQHPIFGCGYGNFGTAYESYLRNLYPEFPRWFIHGQAHSDIMHWAAMIGLPGLGIFLALWAMVTAAALRVWRVSRSAIACGVVAALCQFFLCSLSDASMYEEESRMLGMTLWGLALGIGVSLSKNPPVANK